MRVNATDAVALECHFIYKTIGQIAVQHANRTNEMTDGIKVKTKHCITRATSNCLSYCLRMNDGWITVVVKLLIKTIYSSSKNQILLETVATLVTLMFSLIVLSHFSLRFWCSPRAFCYTPKQWNSHSHR